jgi:uncharacterized RDD family membrane protein YckC
MDGNYWDGTKWTTEPDDFRAARTRPPPVEFAYAGFWVRLLANLIDGVVLVVPAGLVAVIENQHPGIGNLDATPTPESLGFGLARLFLILLMAAYFVFCWSRGGTVGMRLLGLSVVNADTGGRIGVPRAILRYVGYAVGAAFCYLGWIWVAFDEYKQGWHDKLANTIVVHR